jgi:hypothetical protein
MHMFILVLHVSYREILRCGLNDIFIIFIKLIPRLNFNQSGLPLRRR